MDFAAALLAVQVLFAGTPVMCLVDTGSPETMVEHRLWEQITASPPMGRRDIRMLNGDVLAGRFRYVEQVQTGGLVWRDAAVLEVPDGHLFTWPCILGMNLLGRQPLVLDWGTGQLAEWRLSEDAS